MVVAVTEGRARVVIADDDPDIRALVSISVRKAGLELVAAAADGDQAWLALQEYHPDLAVLDVSMPGTTGLELCRLVRADPSLAGLRIVLLSAAADDQDAGHPGQVSTSGAASPYRPTTIPRQAKISG